MPGNRMSSLDLTQYCGLAGTLGNESASSRRAVMGSAWHAVCADQPDKDEWLLKLTPQEAEEIAEWHRPTTLKIEGLPDLEYADAVKEETVALNSRGQFCEKDDPDCISVGHLDCRWIVELPSGYKIAVVNDLKSSCYTVDGPDVLQLAAYSLAIADKFKCDAYVPVIWGGKEGRWLIGKLVDLMDENPWPRVKHAANNVSPRATTGSHCGKCYGWQRCKAYTLKATDTALLGMEDESRITQANAADLLQQAEAYVRVGELTKKRLKLFAAQTPISDGNGKVWKGIQKKGRESVIGVAKLRERMGEDAEDYINRGYETTSYQWVNEK